MDVRDRLQAQGAELDPGQARQLDAAERTIAQAIEANLLKKQEVIGRVRGEKLNAVEARALADAQARLGRPEVNGEVNAELDADAAGTSARRRVLPEDARVGVEGDGKPSARPRLPDSAIPDGRGGRMPGGLETPLPDLGGRRPPVGPGVQGDVPGVQGGRGLPPPPPPAARARQPLSLERAYDVVKAHEQSPGRRFSGAQTRELQQARQVMAGEIKRNLERKMAVTGRPLPVEEAQALARAREVVGDEAPNGRRTADPGISHEGPKAAGGSSRSSSPTGARPAPEASNKSANLPDQGNATDAGSVAGTPGSRSRIEWEQRFRAWRKPNPVQAQDLLVWNPAHRTPALKKMMMDGAQSFFDMLPVDVAKSLGKVGLELTNSLRPGVPAQYFPGKNQVAFSSHLSDYHPLQIQKLMWHEIAHWVFDKAGDKNAHPHLKAWRAKLEQHWFDRTRGEPTETEPVEKWHYIRDSWISIYVGRLYPGAPIGLELPAVYLEEAACGPSRLAWLGRQHPLAQETFDIIFSLFK